MFPFVLCLLVGTFSHFTYSITHKVFFFAVKRCISNVAAQGHTFASASQSSAAALRGSAVFPAVCCSSVLHVFRTSNQSLKSQFWMKWRLMVTYDSVARTVVESGATATSTTRSKSALSLALLTTYVFYTLEAVVRTPQNLIEHISSHHFRCWQNNLVTLVLSHWHLLTGLADDVVKHQKLVFLCMFNVAYLDCTSSTLFFSKYFQKILFLLRAVTEPPTWTSVTKNYNLNNDTRNSTNHTQSCPVGRKLVPIGSNRIRQELWNYM